MKISELMELIRENRGNFIREGKYVMQIYSDGDRGNIKRTNETVLCAFDLVDDGIRIAPTKEELPYEYSYVYLHIGLEENIESISEQSNKNAKELGEVFGNFAETLNNLNKCNTWQVQD